MAPITLEESRRWCHQQMRLAAKNFYFGMSLLPPDKRCAMFALYAYMRHIDDLADDAVDAGIDARIIESNLESWRQVTRAALAGEDEVHPMLPALCAAMRRFAIPADLLDSAIDGQLQDLKQLRYGRFDELRRYCYCVASTVGIAAVYIWGFRDPRVLPLADDRGIAFQLTNILRDLREDYARGRVYLPAEELQRFGVDLDAVFQGGQAEAFEAMMRFQIERAQGFYARSIALESLVEPDARPTLRIMTGIYQGILDRIAEEPLAVLSRKVGLSTVAKFSQVAKGLWWDNHRRIEGEA